MVGMTIGMLALITMLSVYSSFDAQRRSTSNISDAQINGLIAIHTLQSESRATGLGLVTSAGGLACSQMNWYYDGVSGTSTIAPMLITDGAGGRSDSISYSYSDSPHGGDFSQLTANMANSDGFLTVKSINASVFNVNHDVLLLATPSSSGQKTPPCTRLAYVDTTIANPPSTGLALMNPPQGMNIFPANGYQAFSSYAINMGNFIQERYEILNNQLVVTNTGIPGQPSQIIADGIVNIQAQYGIAPMNGVQGAKTQAVNCWTDATGSACAPQSGDWSEPSTADISRIKAIRFAIVARSALKERADKSGVCHATTVAPKSWVGGPAIDLSSDPDWRCYKYRVYHTVTGMRNIIWADM